MIDDFEERLSAITQRAEQAMRRDANKAEMADAQIKKINAAISDWNSRILPVICSIVERANAIIRHADLELIPSISLSHPITFGSRGLRIPDLPVIIVSAQQAGSPIGARRSPDARQLEFEITPNGKLSIQARNYSSKVERTMEAHDFTKEMAENAVAEFAEATWPQ
jgi:hypothetical protein